MNMTLVVGLLLILVAVPLLSKIIFNQLNPKNIAISLAISLVGFSLFAIIGKYAQTVDHEIWSGSVTSKTRDHDSYIETYQCNCRPVCSGTGENRSCSEECDTCSRTHYTVKWKAHSNIGSFSIKDLDSTSSAVYLYPDPDRYKIIEKGDPVAKSVAFKNYVKAVPESVFHNKSIAPEFAKMLPEYPGKIYDIYQINRVLSVNVKISDLAQWNKDLSKLMCELGPMSKANVILVFVNSSDRSYVESLKTAWLNGKKNDAIIVVGTTDYPKIEWVDVFGWSEKEIFKIELAQALQEEGQINKEKFLSIIKDHVKKGFVRRNMEDFAYLEDAVEAPMWVAVLGGIISILMGLGFLFFQYGRSGTVFQKKR